jgi:hypothetical protein
METMLCRLLHHAQGVASCGALLGGIFTWLGRLPPIAERITLVSLEKGVWVRSPRASKP